MRQAVLPITKGRRLPALFAWVAMLAGACGRDARSTPSFIATDSAGVRIIETSSLAVADSTDWSVDTTALVSIGVFDGDDPYVFGDLAGLTRDSQGRIVVADKQANEIRFFDPQGKFLHKVGRTGEGPGEYFYFMQLMTRAPDSLAVFDYEGLRVNILDRDGRHVRSYRPHLQANTGPRITAMWSDGSLLAVEEVSECTSYRRMVEGKGKDVCIDSARFIRRRENGDVMQTYGPLVAAREQYARIDGGSVALLSDRHPQGYWAAHDDRFYYSDAERMEVRVYGAGGALERIMRVRYDPPAPTSETFTIAMVARFNSTGTSDAAERARLFHEAAAAVPLPARLPAHTGLLVDRVGNVWLRQFQPPIRRPGHAARWFVFDTTGVLRHSLRIPALLAGDRFTRWSGEVGDDYVLGYWRDADRVETVRYLPLHKSVSQR